MTAPRPVRLLCPAPRSGVLLACALVLLLVPASVRAQDCDDALGAAEAQYVSGRFDAAIDELTACLDGGAFTREERERAYRLIGLSFIGKDLRDEARRAIEQLLALVPDYEPDPVDDPPPFVQLVEELRTTAPARAPVVHGTLGDVTLRLGGPAWERDLSTLFSHPDGRTLAYDARVEAPGIVAASLDGSRLTLAAREAGRTRLLLTARGPSGPEATHAVDLRVEAEAEAVAERRTGRRSGRRLGRWLLIGGGLVAGGVAAAVLAGGGGGDAGGGSPIGGPPPLPGIR